MGKLYWLLCWQYLQKPLFGILQQEKHSTCATQKMVCTQDGQIIESHLIPADFIDATELLA
ncbi:hypothetical protein OK016_21330 [Vibrio chagasii]|nr:hypothetical protein [Vibrio chagasii]